MREWNVLVTVQEDGYNKARRLLERYGAVGRTDFFNVLMMHVEDQQQFLGLLREEAETGNPDIQSLARVMPLILTFDFRTPEEFEAKAREAVSSMLPALSGKSFHVRMHRRGFKGRISGMEEEKFLDAFLLQTLEKTGNPGRITFEDPDCIIAIETLGTRAGLSLWTRDDMKRYPLLHLD